MKKMIPVKKQRAKDDLRLLPFMAKNSGTKAIQARKLKSNVGKDRISSRAEARDERIPILSIPSFD